MGNKRPILVLVVAALTVLSPVPLLLLDVPGGPPGNQQDLWTGTALLPRDEGVTSTTPGSTQSLSDIKVSHNLNPVGLGLSCPVGGSGYLVTVNYTLHEGRRWDYVYLDFEMTAGYVIAQVRNPEHGSFPLGTALVRKSVQGQATEMTVDLYEIEPEGNVSLEVAILLDHQGETGTPPRLMSWEVGECDVDYWHDTFNGVERDSDHGHLAIGDGTVKIVQTHIPGGLIGKYYNSLGFQNFVMERLDPTIDFNWGNGNPGGGMGSNTFSIRWEGKIMAPSAGTYTFYIRTDDGCRLWVEDLTDPIIDEWQDQATEHSGQVILSAGFHDIKIEYYENGGGARCELRWSGPSISKNIVPPSALWGRKATNVLESDEISIPEGQVWDMLFLDFLAMGVPVRFDVIDATNDLPIGSLTNLAVPALDISGLSSGLYPKIRLRARWDEGEPTDSSVLQDWGVKWMPERTWRCEFNTNIKLAGNVGLTRRDGYIQRATVTDQASAFAFAESYDGLSHLIDSHVYMPSYWSQGIPTINASDVAMADIDGDGLDDVIYTSGDTGVNATAFRATAAGYSTAPTWTFHHDAGQGGGAFFAKVLADDLDGDGDTDVVLVERNWSRDREPDRLLVFIQDGEDWTDVPDQIVVNFFAPITDIDSGDVDDDGYKEIGFVQGTGFSSNAMVLDGGPNGYRVHTDNGTILYRSYDFSSIIIEDLNGDDYEDVIVSGDLTGGPTLDNTQVHRGRAVGVDGVAFQSFDGPPATSLTVLDWDGDGRRDIALARPDTIVVMYQSSIGFFSTSASYTLQGVFDIVTILAAGDVDEDIAFASNSPLYDGSGFVQRRGSTGYWAHLFHTDNATAVAAGRLFGEATGTLRTVPINVGDLENAGKWGNLSFRMRNGSPSLDQEMELRLVDAGTDEVLWNVTTTSGKGSYDLSDIVPLKDHPMVVIEAYLTNWDTIVALELGHLELGWTKREPEPPTVLDLTVEDGTIYRTNSTAVRVTLTDDFDPPEDLDLLVQMRPPQAAGWIVDRLNTPEWDGSGWNLTFSSTRDDPVGAYSFRARATDMDMLDSEWLERTDVVMVINNPPGQPTIGIGPEAPTTLDDIVCTIVRQASDRDTAYMEYEYWWSVDGVLEPGETNATVPASITTKGEEWTVVVRAWDGEDLGPSVTASTTIGNSPPRYKKPLGSLEPYEDSDPITIRLADHFDDPDGDPIQFTLTLPEHVVVTLNEATGTLTITLPADWYGTQRAVVNASDGLEWVEGELVIDVISVPDPPVIVSIGGISPVDGRFKLEAKQKVRSVYHVVVEDVDSSKFKFRTDTDFGIFTIVTGNGTMTFEPVNSEVGSWAFNLSVEDAEGNSVVVPIDIIILNYNDSPSAVEIILPKRNRVFEYNANILLQGSCTDPDEIHGQILTFTWSSDISGVIALGPSNQTSILPSGEHNITLEVSDGQLSRSSKVHITILKKPVEPNGNGGGGGGGDGPLDPLVSGSGGWWFALILFILVVVVAALIAVRARRATGAKPARVKAEPVEAPVKEDAGGPLMIEGIPMSMFGTGAERSSKAQPATDMRSVMLGTSASGASPSEGIPVSPWTSEALMTPTRAPLLPPPPPSGPQGWEMEVEPVPSRPHRPAAVPPPPPPPRADAPPAVAGTQPVLTPPPPPPPSPPPPRPPVTAREAWVMAPPETKAPMRGPATPSPPPTQTPVAPPPQPPAQPKRPIPAEWEEVD